MRRGSRGSRYAFTVTWEGRVEKRMRAGDREPCVALVCIRELCGCVCRGSCGGMCVCRMYIREGFYWCRSGRVCAVGCGVRGWREKRVHREGGISWSARNTHFTKENCQLPDNQISFVGIFQLPMVDSDCRSYSGMFARCLTHERRDTISGFLPHPHPWSFPGTDVFACVYHSTGHRAAFLGRQSSEQNCKLQRKEYFLVLVSSCAFWWPLELYYNISMSWFPIFLVTKKNILTS